MQAIITKCIAPSNTRGARIKAAAAAGAITIPHDALAVGACREQDIHRRAAECLRAKLGWDSAAYGKLATGGLPDGSFAHVFVRWGA